MKGRVAKLALWCVLGVLIQSTAVNREREWEGAKGE